jgi:hypothetical protein
MAIAKRAAAPKRIDPDAGAISIPTSAVKRERDITRGLSKANKSSGAAGKERECVEG